MDLKDLYMTIDELFKNYSRDQINEYFKYAIDDLKQNNKKEKNNATSQKKVNNSSRSNQRSSS